MASRAAETTTGWVTDLSEAADPARILENACRSLATRGRNALRRLEVAELVAGIDLVCRRWLDSSFPYRKQVIERVEAETGMSQAVIAHGLDVELRNYSADSLMMSLRS